MTESESSCPDGGPDEVEELLGHRFADRDLLRSALTHSSVRLSAGTSYERLEFLGDAVLNLVIGEHLYRECPEEGEGALTRIKSALVSGAMLCTVARRLGLERHAVVDKGVAQRGVPDSVLSDIFEALIGALYLDSGLDAARRFILKGLAEESDRLVVDRAVHDPKSRLQHYAQRECRCDPAYRIVEETGPPHERRFRAAVSVGQAEYVSGWAASKASAERGAAQAALEALRPAARPADEDPAPPSP